VCATNTDFLAPRDKPPCQANALGASADGAKGRQRIEARFCDHAVADPDGMKSESLGAIGEIIDTVRIDRPDRITSRVGKSMPTFVWGSFMVQ